MSQRKTMIEAMLKEDASDPFLHYALALEFLKEENLTESLTKLKYLADQHSSYLPTYYQLGKCLEAAGEYDEAVQVYHKGAALAEQQGERKTKGEISEALMILEDFLEDQGES